MEDCWSSDNELRKYQRLTHSDEDEICDLIECDPSTLRVRRIGLRIFLRLSDHLVNRPRCQHPGCKKARCRAATSSARTACATSTATVMTASDPSNPCY